MVRWIFVFAAASALCAGEVMNRLEERVSSIEKDLQDRKFPPRYAEPISFPGTIGVIHFEGEALWWKAETMGGAYAVVGDLVAGTNNPFTNSKVKAVRFPSHPGFRLHAGYFLDQLKWDMDLVYTRLHVYGQRSNATDGVATIMGLTQAFHSNIVSISAANEAYAHAKIKVDLADFLFQRPFWPAAYFGVKPFFGVRAGNIIQSEDVEYIGFLLTDPAVTGQDFVRLYNRVKGIGLIGGFDLAFGIAWGVEISSSLSLSSLMASHRLKHQETLIPEGLVFDDRQTVRRILNGMQTSLGLRWGSYLWKNKTFLSFHAAYEFMSWFLFNQTFNFFPNPGSATATIHLIDDDLDLQGLSFGAKLLF